MSSNYTIAFAGLPALLDEQEHVMENFTFERYPDSFKRYCNKHKATLKAVEDGYLQVIDKEQFLTNMAEELANSAEKRIAEEEKKNAKEKLAANLNMCLVIYTLPAVLEMNKAPANLFPKRFWKPGKHIFRKPISKLLLLSRSILDLNGNSVTSPQQCAEHLAKRMIVMS